MEAYQRQQVELELNNNELLVDTLKTIWHNYLQTLDDAEVKQHWLQLFLYNFQFVSKSILDNDDFKSFFNPIPEEICSFLLEQVYEIISKSDLYTPSVLDTSTAAIHCDIESDIDERYNDDEFKQQQQQQQATDKNKKFQKLIKRNHNFAQLILKQPSDCSKIIALREFLTHHLGKDILEFLLKIDLKLVASQKSLCNLCINLFPNCPWNETTQTLQQLQQQHADNLFAFIGNLQIYQRTKLRTLNDEMQNNVGVKANDEEDNCVQQKTTNDFESFQQTSKTSDEIALLLIEILSKCTENEALINNSNATMISDNCLAIMALNFSLDCLRADNKAFSSQQNAELIKKYLLRLTEQCLNNLLTASAASNNNSTLNHIQFQCIFAKLVGALESNMNSIKLLYALLYLIFAILNNIVAIYTMPQKPTQLQQHKTSLYSLKFIDDAIIDACLATMDHLLSHHPPTDDQKDLCRLFQFIFHSLIRIVENLTKYDLMLSLSGSTNSNISAARLSASAPLRFRKLKTKQMHCFASLPRLSCFFQNILITLLPSLPKQLQEQTILYLAKSGLCCCHYTLALANSLLATVHKISAYYQKCAFKFLYVKCLQCIFLRTSLEQQSILLNVSSYRKPTSTYSCSKCDMKLKSIEFHTGLIQIYKNFYATFQKQCTENYTDSLLLFLKHLKHISHLLTNDIASGILAEIVLPVFRMYKQQILKTQNASPKHTAKFWQQKSADSPTQDQQPNRRPELHLKIKPNQAVLEDANRLLNECLNIFAMYLKDIRLIKAFYNEENIRHLEELLDEPFLIRGVCDLIKIGIDNITFLGDSTQEQSALSKRLITLQLNSSESANQLFHSLIQRIKQQKLAMPCEFWLNETTPAAAAAESHWWADADNKELGNLSIKMEILDILHIVALQWTLNFELLKTSQYFYNEFAKIYSISSTEEAQEEQLQQPNFNLKLKQGDKTIFDILKLNYNALLAFLLLMPNSYRKSQKKSMNTFDYLQQHQQYNEFDSISESWDNLDSLIFAIQNEDERAKAQNYAFSIATAASSVTQSIFANSELEYSGDDDDDNDYGQEVNSLMSSFYSELQQKDKQYIATSSLQLNNNSPDINESITIFDIRQQENFLSKIYTNKKTTTNNNDVISTTTTSRATSYETLLRTSAVVTDKTWSFSATERHSLTATAALASAKTTTTSSSTTATNNPNADGIINKIFNIFGSIFSLKRTYSSFFDLNNQSENDINFDLKLLPLYEPHSDCKKLLLKLFEATMAICIKAYQNEEEKMQNYLRKLQAIILTSATNNWEQHVEDHSRENSIVKALQCLLKIAEITNTNGTNEPVTVVSSSILTSVTDEPQQQQHLTNGLLDDLMPRTRSFNSSRLAGGSISYNYLQLSSALPTCKTGITTPATPQTQRPLSGDSCADDYFSTRGSRICADSELEFSENEHDDFYLTADEGYEADGENVPELSETEGGGSEVHELWHSFQPSSRYRSHILHEGICQLVIEILIELSRKCSDNPLGWSDHLVQLVNRLFVIRESLGGSLFLLKGFAPVLQCNDFRLKELQQSILELIVDLNTPEVLSIFFGILATKNPPVDVLMKYLYYVCTNTVRKCQPAVELEFPISIDGKCIATSDCSVSEHIDRLRNYHLHSQANTPLTRSPCIIPITHARLWTTEGFTLSLWLQAKGSQLHKSLSQLIDEDAKSSSELYLKTHIVSVGTNQAMLSIYLNSNMNLVFETFKPNSEIQLAQSTTHLDESYEEKAQMHQQTPNFDKKASQRNNHHQVPHNNNNNVNHKNQRGEGPTSAATASVPTNSTASPFSKALKHTKSVLNTFSKMNLFNGHAEAEAYFESSHEELRDYSFVKNKWTHFTFAVEVLTNSMELLIHIDGLEEHSISLPFPNVHNLTRTHCFQLIALGDGCISKSPNTTSCTESRSTLDSFPQRFNLSNLMLFDRSIISKNIIVNLTAMGPDLTELTQCHVANWKPNYGYLNLAKVHDNNTGTTGNSSNFVDSMRILRSSRILCYSALQPDLVMGYDCSMELDNITYGHPYGLMLYGELIQNELKSLQTATLLCGGLSNLLYLFARVVEISSNSNTQAMALDILLTVAFSESQLYTEFQRNDYISLIGYVIKTERCAKDCHLLKSIVNNTCSQPLILKKGDTLHVNDNTVATIVYPKLLVSILHRYSDWHRSGADNSDVLDMLFLSILALTREKHPHRDFNIEQFGRAGLMKELLNLCKVYVIESPNPVFISKDAAEYFVNIISIFAGSPPPPSLLDEIMKLLLLLHKPSECYITHDRTRFYFLLTGELPQRENLLTSASAFKRNISLRRKNKTTGVTSAQNESNTNNSSTQTSSSDLDSGRQSRINRLRKIHRASSTYKKPLHEFEDNLENVADITKLNKNAFRLIDPSDIANWRLKFKTSTTASTTNSSPTNSPNKFRKNSMPTTVARHSPNLLQQNKIQRKRVRLNSLNSLQSINNLDNADGKLARLRRKSRISNSSSAPSFNMDFSECSTGSNEIFKRKLRTFIKHDTLNTIGIATLQSGLLLLLKDFLCLLPDNAIDVVLHHYIKLEYLLVLANHQSTNVRTAVIRLTKTLTERLFPQDILVCSKNLYPYHLANQLAITATDYNMFEACLEWVSSMLVNLNLMLQPDFVMRIQNRFGLNALLAIASKSVDSTINNQNDFSTKCFRVLKKFYQLDLDSQQIMIEAGLIQSAVKALHCLYSKSAVVSAIYNRIEDSIAELLIAIGEISLKSIGHISIIWDIINMLAFYQERQPESIIKGFRSMQAKLQMEWLNMYFVKTNVPWSFRALQQLPNCSLSSNENKTRLELLINRCCQFFMVFKSVPTKNEIELFQFLVSYSIATNQRCNNFIAWGLQPSQPRHLRCFIVDALWISCQDDFLPAIICDGKTIRALLYLCLLEDLKEPIENLPNLCKRLGINEHDSTWNLENELQRIVLQKTTESAKQKPILDKTVYRFETLAQACIESSMMTTRRVAELQNSERKLLMNYMKDYDDTYTYTKWLDVVKRMSHEGAPWHSKHCSEDSWELDETEGPSRVHTRLKRCHLDLDKRFFMHEYHNDDTQQLETMSNGPITTTTTRSDHCRPLDYLISSYDQQLNISLNSQILYNFPAKYLPVDGEIDGEIIVTDHKLCFLATYRCKYFYINCDISNITEIWLKRYQHQEKAFEIFLDTNQSLFFSLQNQEDWKIMRDVFCDKIVQSPDHSKILQITQQWREGLLTNWEYLMTLNQIAGRTYNDLMQYPVFPWILANYLTDTLDLTDPSNFRKLHKPIAVQNEENEQHYINNYTYIKNTMTNMGSMILKPYHYSSHYSNSGTVLHFLVRVPPFTSYFLRYQDNNFDLPDRTFHALSTTWRLASHDSPTDVKELIPEFFCLPEMFENFERFNFGCRQSGERVEDVTLPAWCLKDPRLFILIHRQALETEMVRNNLHNWIDLIFGFKQTGDAAVEAINVFHPATYAMFLESEISDPIEREAVKTMVKTYGQMPRQLFKQLHPSSKSLNYQETDDQQILPSVRGLRWGIYLGSPQLPKPTLGNIHKLPGAEYLLSFNNTNVVYGLPARSCVMQGAEMDTYNVISWGYDDRIVRIQPLNKVFAKPKNLLYNSPFDDITACGCDPNSNQLWFGHKSGRISVYKCAAPEVNQRVAKSRQSYVKGLKLSYNSAVRKITSKALDSATEGGDLTASSATSSNSLNTAESVFHKDGADLSWTGPTVLIRHTDEISCISLSVEFKIAVTAGKDGIAVIWDLNSLSYVRTIERPAEIHHSPISLVSISPTLGDIVSVHSLIPTQQKTAVAPTEQQNIPIQPPADECFEVTEENLDDFVNVCINPNGKSILRLHSVNARYIQHIVHEDSILAVCYSYIKEGVGVNVIATAVEGGIVRLWSSWNLSFITEIITGISNIRSITYSTHQHLVVLTKESHIQVWETEGLRGNSPKFPQIAYK